MNFSNPALLDQKLKLLEDPNIEIKAIVSFDFHGISINFHTSEAKLASELLAYLPPMWIKAQATRGIDIFHTNFPELGIDWVDESSSDIHSPNPETAIQRDFAAQTNPKEKNCYVFFEGAIDDGLHNFMRWFLSPRLITSQKMILHSSALACKKTSKAYLFLGPSGAGKTTVTSLGGERLVLSDDMNLLDFSDSITISPGGVGGLYKPQVSIDAGFDIDTAYWLVQSNSNSVKNVSLKIQSRYLLASMANMPWSSIDSSDSLDVLEVIEKVLSKLQIRELHFKKDSSFWELL